MRILTAEQMRTAEKLAVEAGTDFETLMERAGCGAAESILAAYGEIDSVLILLGKGNNGGDGLVIARKMLEELPDLTVILLFTMGHALSPLAALNLARLEPFGERVTMIDFEDMTDEMLETLCLDSDLIIDGIFGTGFSGSLPIQIAHLLRLVNRTGGGSGIALDIPTGLNCDHGIPAPDTFKAERTYAFSSLKPAHILKRSQAYCGETEIIDIGIADELIESIDGTIRLLNAGLAAECLPMRDPDSNKGSFGKLLNIGGCQSMTGAVLLSSMAAYRCGVGLVMTAAPEIAMSAVRLRLPEAVHCVLPTGETGAIAAENAFLLTDKLNNWATAGLIGCGMSVTEESKALIRAILTDGKKPLVIDADGLNCIAAMGEDGLNLLNEANAPLILTPHMLEFARLTGLSIDAIKADRFAAAADFARKHHLTLVLKDSNTVVASPEGQLSINENGNSGMSKGGSGDVLAGMIASFLAQGAKPEDAALCGVYLHAAAGDIAARKLTQYAMLPGDLIDALPEAFGDILWIEYKEYESEFVF